MSPDFAFSVFMPNPSGANANSLAQAALRRKLMGEIPAAAEPVISRHQYRVAQESKALVDGLADDIAARFGGRVAHAPVKGLARAREKVFSDYAGDWYEIKDLARLTIILPNAGAVPRVVDEIYKEFSARQGGGVLKRKQVLAAADPCGYSGDTVFVVTASGGPAEIQINVPEVIYAKESEDFVRPVLGEAELTRIRSMYRLTGGIGHILYELYRSPKATHAGRFADLSKRYYEYFRSPPNGRIRVALVSEIEALRELVPGRIPHRVSW